MNILQLRSEKNSIVEKLAQQIKDQLMQRLQPKDNRLRASCCMMVPNVRSGNLQPAASRFCSLRLLKQAYPNSVFLPIAPAECGFVCRCNMPVKNNTIRNENH
jgi:hypothetical protein